MLGLAGTAPYVDGISLHVSKDQTFIERQGPIMNLGRVNVERVNPLLG
jgi:hypothetical protein